MTKPPLSDREAIINIVIILEQLIKLEDSRQTILGGREWIAKLRQIRRDLGGYV